MVEMGSMYMNDNLLTGNLISTGYRKFWTVQTNDPREKKCHGNVQTVRHRSKSCGAVTRATRVRGPSDTVGNEERAAGISSRDTKGYTQQRSTGRRAVFGDSVLVVTNAGEERRAEVRGHVTTGGDRKSTDIELDVARNGVELSWRNMVGPQANSGFARLDMKTLQEIGWVSGADENTKQLTNEDLYKLTKVEFKRLQDQVRDVSISIRNKFRTSAYQSPSGDTANGQKLYQRPAAENPAQVYRSQLAASLRAFQQRQWQPLNHQELDTNYIRCKPVQPAAHNERPSTSCSVRGSGTTATRLQRPKSVPASSLRPKSGRRGDTPSGVRPGKFDTLSPMVISELMGEEERPTSGYETRADDKSPFVDELVEETKKLIENDDTSTTSGIDSGASDNESPSSDEDSDFEPEIDKDIDIPQLNLRPEKLDALYIPEPKRGWRQYDFDMSNIDIPPYEFESPFPSHIEDLDLRQMAKFKWNWRNHVKVKTDNDSDLGGILDRLVEFEKLQLDTIEWENKRASQLKKQATKRNGSAKPVIKDKRCDPNCLQATCFGDCPEKLVQSNTCEICRQGYCTGTCKETKYEQRMRQSRQEEERPVTPKSPFPRACPSCQRRHNAKFINANNLVIGTQRFNNATFTRGQSSMKARDVRPRTPATLSKDVLQEFEKLNIEATQPSRPQTAGVARPRSRNALFPGKSFYSQRKNSLTELDKVGVAKKKQRVKSCTRLKRPKTAG
ncbi:uncharacterized protein LOC128243815 isoform X2 [Mya arenaria]|uniref:uncharacterized protein LOC128243815 isoform X2 n=1 Tax=Mya arenaria TaxID=6604 RepID=UPI0022E33851|nr:uncharacterized protein LOC128243815 isoform X2 [Mya arenaria]